MPELSSNNSETSIGNCARNEEEEKQVLRARKRLREKEELKRQIAEDLRAIDKLKKQREKTKEEAKRRLFQKEREQRAQGLEQWKRQREEQRQRQVGLSRRNSFSVDDNLHVALCKGDVKLCLDVGARIIILELTHNIYCIVNCISVHYMEVVKFVAA